MNWHNENHYHEFLAAYPIAEGAICFVMPPEIEMRPLAAIADLVRLPYDFCWFEGEPSCNFEGIKPNTRPCFHAYRHSDGIYIRMFERTSEGIFELLAAGLYSHGDAPRFTFDLDVKQISNDNLKEMAASIISANCHWLARFLTVLNCSNVSRTEERPPEKLQKSRAAKGKKPLFSYWVLQLTARNKNVEHQGGSHASPRLHLRRGHIRKLEERHVWVNPCVVGNKQLGMVHKDYAMRAPQ